MELSGDLERANSVYRKGLAIDAEQPEIHYNLANTLVHMNRLPEALQHYGKTLELRPGDFGANHNMGVALIMSGRFKEAVAYLRKALEIQPDSDEARRNLEVATHEADLALESPQPESP